MNLKDALIALLSLFDVMSGAVLALSYGFLMFPSAIGYAVGAIGSAITGAATPVSFMYESMALSWGISKKLRDRISMIIFAALLTGVLGAAGLPQFIVDSVGREIFLGMLAGVGLYLAKVGLDIAFRDLIIGLPCLAVAVVVQLLTNDLVITVTTSVPFGIILNFILEKVITGRKKNRADYKIPSGRSWFDMVRKEMKLIPLIFNRNVLVGTLALSTLTIGGNIAYTAANSQLSQTPATYNQSTIISGIADFASSFFGGANMELIITPTATAPHPVAAAILFMTLAALILASGLVYRIAKRIPIAAMGGYLFVIGAILILPYNAIDAFETGDGIVVSLTMAFTLLTNPFYGIVAGTVSKIFIGI